MLVCSVSLRPPRSAIAADVAEVTAAVDATATGNVVFATLVDDPASVGDIVDAYLGEIMLEAASADAAIDAGLVYVAALDEAAIAADTPDGVVPTIYTDTVAETVTAAALVDATKSVGTAVTTTNMTGPLFMLDATFPSASLTVINVGR
jgi:hypothetical protein